tara:strand:- start:1139 stop:1777 length:639 start_codon:yes stop_codon:yes gene_type:complete
MKKLLLLTSLIFTAASLHGVSIVTSTNSQSPTAWASTINMTPPSDGDIVSYNAFASADVFAQGTVQGVAGTSIYKRGHANSANAAAWLVPFGPNYSQGGQYFYLTPESISASAKWRTLKTASGGAYVFGAWQDIDTVGSETSIAITAGVTFNRQVGVQIQGVNSFSSFRHYQMTTHGIDELSLEAEVVPEPSTYALMAGFAAFLFVALKRRK